MIAIRPARPADAEAIAAVHDRTWREAYWGMLPTLAAEPEGRDARYWRSLTRRVGADPTARDHVVFVAVDANKEVIGFAWAGPARGAQEPWEGEIYMLYVLEQHHRQGVGGALVAACARRLVYRGLFSLGAWVVEDNGPARAFYEAAGGRLSASGLQLVRGARVDVVGYLWEEAGSLFADITPEIGE